MPDPNSPATAAPAADPNPTAAPQPQLQTGATVDPTATAATNGPTDLTETGSTSSQDDLSAGARVDETGDRDGNVVTNADDDSKDDEHPDDSETDKVARAAMERLHPNLPAFVNPADPVVEARRSGDWNALADAWDRRFVELEDRVRKIEGKQREWHS